MPSKVFVHTLLIKSLKLLTYLMRRELEFYNEKIRDDNFYLSFNTILSNPLINSFYYYLQKEKYLLC